MPSSKKINASKSAAIHHSPRDRVFRLLKVGHLLNSLVRTTFIMQTKEYSAKNGSNSNQLLTVKNAYGWFIQQKKDTHLKKEGKTKIPSFGS